MPEGVRACLGRRMAILRPNTEKVLPEFLLYSYLAPEFQQLIASNTITGATVDRISLTELPKYEMRIPDLDEQKKLVSILSLLDKKIEVNKLQVNELDALAKVLFEYWFVQYDFPISASVARTLGDLSLVGRPYRASGCPMQFNKLIGRYIPACWSDRKISAMFDSIRTGDWGQDNPTGNYTTEVYCIRGTDIPPLNGLGTLSPPVRFILPRNEGRILRPNDIVIEISGGAPDQSTGRVTALTSHVFARFEKPLICSNFCKALTLTKDAGVFFFYQLWSHLYDQGVFFNWEGKTSGIKNLLFETFADSQSVVRPDAETTTRFEEIIGCFEKTKQISLIEIAELSKLRNWLLPLLMAGKVRVT